MWSFENPAFLGLLLCVPALIWYRHFRKKRGGTVRFAFANWQGDFFVPPFTLQRGLSFVLNILFWLGFSLVIVALAGPVSLSRERIFLNRGLDIMLVVDTSPSMASQDFGEKSRLSQARETIRSFLRKRENDSIGLVVFGNEAQLRVPLTLDYKSLEAGLDQLKIMELGDGTALGLGLTLAAVHLKDSSAGEKIVILLTDGENNAGEITPDVASGMLKSLGIRVYTIGIGVEGEVPLEYVDPGSGKLMRGTYTGHFDEELLKRLAQQTGGQYFSARSPGILESSLQTIDSLEKVESRVRIQIVKTSLTRYILLIGLALICLDAFLRRLLLKELA